MIDAMSAADVFLKAADLNLADPLLKGCLLAFPNYGQLVMTGDLHGHRRNFERIRRYCDLERFGARHVILHEIVHEELVGLDAKDDSHLVFLEAAKWKCEYPDQVHFLLGNHELAQLSGHDITKNGRVVTAAFDESVAKAYGREAPAVQRGMADFIRSLPLAGRTPNRVMLSHSLPSPRELPTFDATVLSRAATEADLRERGPAHAMVWGRYHTEPALRSLREVFDVDFFICGHQPQETGFDVQHECLIILASDHNHGVFMTVDLSKPVTLESLTRTIRPLASLE